MFACRASGTTVAADPHMIIQTISSVDLEQVTGGVHKAPVHHPKAPAFPNVERLPPRRVVPDTRSFCQREPFACANMRTGGNI